MTPILITLPIKVVEIELTVAAAVVVRPRFFEFSSLPFCFPIARMI